MSLQSDRQAIAECRETIATKRARPAEPAPDFLADPSPDAGHEAIRVAVLAAIAKASGNTDDLGMCLSNEDTVFALLDGALVALDDLTSRVALLEATRPLTP